MFKNDSVSLNCGIAGKGRVPLCFVGGREGWHLYLRQAGDVPLWRGAVWFAGGTVGLVLKKQDPKETKVQEKVWFAGKVFGLWRTITLVLLNYSPDANLSEARNMQGHNMRFISFKKCKKRSHSYSLAWSGWAVSQRNAGKQQRSAGNNSWCWTQQSEWSDRSYSKPKPVFNFLFWKKNSAKPH